MEIREAKIEDLKEIQKLYHFLLKFEQEEFVPILEINWPFTEEGKKHLENGIIGENNCTWIVKNKNNEIIGFLMSCFHGESEHKDAITAEINHLYVKPEYRDHHLGTKLVEIFKDWAKEKGATKLDVFPYFANKSAMGFYEKMGFKPYAIKMEEDA